MKTFVRITGNFIIAFGFLAVIGGIITIFRLSDLSDFFSSYLTPIFGSNTDINRMAVEYIPSVLGGKIILDGLIYMAAGEFLVLFVELVQILKKIADK